MANGLNGNIGKLLQKYIDFQDNGDVFVHLAAKSYGSYKEIVKSNIVYLLKTIDFCKNNSIQNFIFFSAISIYNKDDIYSISKKLGEKILEESDLNVLVIRLPMVLTKDRKNGILNKIREKLEKNEDVALYNAHKKFNNFICIEDIAYFIKNYRFDKNFEIVELATDSNMTFLEVVELLKKSLNSNSKIQIEKDKDYLSIDLLKAKQKGFKSYNTKKALKDWLKWK